MGGWLEKPGGDILNGLSVCSGIGGLDLGLERALPGYRAVCYVEGEAFAAATLVAQMEASALVAAPVWNDLRSFDPGPWRGKVDIISGGYPCQPFSVAGRRRGKDDPRHLWPWIADIVRSIAPRLCFFENVAGHLHLGCEEVVSELEGMGYSVAVGLFTASEVGAPHKRERLFILANAESRDGGLQLFERGSQQTVPESGGAGEVVAHEWPAWPPGPKVGPDEWPSEVPQPCVCRGAHAIPNRVDRLRALGNAVVPAQAEHAFRVLLDSMR